MVTPGLSGWKRYPIVVEALQGPQGFALEVAVSRQQSG